MARTNEPCVCGDPECGRCFPQPPIEFRPRAARGPWGQQTRERYKQRVLAGDDGDPETRQRIPHPDRGQPELHLVEDPDGHWEVWLNTGVSDYDGLVIGVGDTRDDAIRDAVGVAEWAERELQQPAPPVDRATLLRRVYHQLSIDAGGDPVAGAIALLVLHPDAPEVIGGIELPVTYRDNANVSRCRTYGELFTLPRVTGQVTR